MNVQNGTHVADLQDLYGARQAHPYADLWPLLPDTELRQLADDIRVHGLREPVWLHPDGRIVDGRNRWRACLLAGIEPTTRVYQGTEEELLPFLISLNMARRHMDESQRSMVAAKIARLPLGANQHGTASDEGVSIDTPSLGDAAELMNVGRATAARARKVQENAAPELVEAVESGRVSVSAAAGLVHAPAEEQRRVAEVSKTEDYRETQAAIQEARARIDLFREPPTLTTGAHVGYNSGDNEWYTPAEYIKAARATMGGIDLDPASSPTANENIGAERFYTEQDDGLTQPWAGRIWMNPPYAQPLVYDFCARLAKQYAAGNVTAACVLVNNGTETNWFQTLAAEAAALCFPRGRVKFWHPTKEAIPLQGQAVMYLGENVEAFEREFANFGFVAVL